jgi:hypothetical protein
MKNSEKAVMKFPRGKQTMTIRKKYSEIKNSLALDLL